MTATDDTQTRTGEDTGEQAGRRGLFAPWERRVRFWAIVFAG